MAFTARIILFFGGLTGAAGVMMAAAAYHGGNAALQSAALICLANGPALIGLSILSERSRAALAAGTLMIFGTALFAGDLVASIYAGAGLFKMAAPVGGTAVIASWLLAALTAVLPAKRD